MLCVKVVSKGLNISNLTFDTIGCENSKSKVGPKKKFARYGSLVPSPYPEEVRQGQKVMN